LRPLADQCRWVLFRFYPNNSVGSEEETLASLSASALAIMDSGFPLLLSANDVSPHLFHFQVPVKMPVSNLDCKTILHP